MTKNNFIIALAPYFFPLYAVMVVLLFLAGNWFWNWKDLRGVVSSLAGRELWFSCDLDVAYFEEHSVGHYRARLLVFRSGHFSGERLRVACGGTVADRQVKPLAGLDWWAIDTFEVLRGLLRLW